MCKGLIYDLVSLYNVPAHLMRTSKHFKRTKAEDAYIYMSWYFFYEFVKSYCLHMCLNNLLLNRSFIFISSCRPLHFVSSILLLFIIIIFIAIIISKMYALIL